MHHPRDHRALPKIWLMTDERIDGRLEQHVEQLPEGSGIVFRHHHLDASEREARFRQILSLANENSIPVSLAAHPQIARDWGADGVHGRQWDIRQYPSLFHTAPVHDATEIAEAKRNGADLFFLSPVFLTRSHPEKTPLSPTRLQELMNLCDGAAILLGGMDAARFQQYAKLHPYGWAAIDGLAQ